MMNGILRIQTYRPRQSAPVEGVTVVITGSGFTAHRITDAEGNAEDVAICAPACALSLDENNTTTLPYACVQPDGQKAGLPHRPHPGHPDLCRAGHAGPA